MRALTYILLRSVSATRTNATTLVAHPRPAVRASSSEASGRVSEGKKQEAPVAQVPGRRGRGRAVQASRGEGPSVPSVPAHAAGWDCHCFCPPPPPSALTGFLDSFELGGSVVRSTVSGPSWRCPAHPSAAVPARLCFWFLFLSQFGIAGNKPCTFVAWIAVTS